MQELQLENQEQELRNRFNIWKRKGSLYKNQCKKRKPISLSPLMKGGVIASELLVIPPKMRARDSPEIKKGSIQ